MTPSLFEGESLEWGWKGPTPQLAFRHRAPEFRLYG